MAMLRSSLELLMLSPPWRLDMHVSTPALTRRTFSVRRPLQLATSGYEALTLTQVPVRGGKSVFRLM